MSGVQIAALKDTDLFKPLKVGEHTLSNKVVYPPTTRLRALDDHTPSDLELEYYDKRSKYAGSLLITEATFVSEQAGLYSNVPGIWNEKHVKGWKEITDRIHENGSFISSQFWFLGRVGDAQLLKDRGLDFVAPSAIYPDDTTKEKAEAAGNPIRALTEKEIHDIIYDTSIPMQLRMLLQLVSTILNSMQPTDICLINSCSQLPIKEPINMVVVSKQSQICFRVS